MNDSEKNKYNIMKSVFSLSMLDKFPCGIIVIRRKSNYKIVYFNQFLKNLLGYSEDDAKKVISKDNILQFIPVSERAETEKKISQVESGGGMVECSIHLFRKNGSLCLVTCLISSGHENDLSGTIHCIGISNSLQISETVDFEKDSPQRSSVTFLTLLVDTP